MNYLRKTPFKYPFSLDEMKQSNPNVSFPSELSEDLLKSYGVHRVKDSPIPDYDPLTQNLVESTPVLSDGSYVQKWEIVPLTDEEILSNFRNRAEVLKQLIVDATQQRLDTFARTRNYDSILSACTYATSLNPKFKAEGQRCVELRDSTWAALYQILEEVQQGARPAPTDFSDIEPELPVLSWE